MATHFRQDQDDWNADRLRGDISRDTSPELCIVGSLAGCGTWHLPGLPGHRSVPQCVPQWRPGNSERLQYPVDRQGLAKGVVPQEGIEPPHHYEEEDSGVHIG